MTERPSKGVALTVGAVALLFGMASVGALSRYAYAVFTFITIPAFCAALCYLFVRVRRRWTVAVPVAAAAVGALAGVDPLIAFAVVCFCTVAAAAYAISVLRREEPFFVHLIQVILFSAFWAALFLGFLLSSFGSISDGLQALSDTLKEFLELALEASGAGESVDGTTMARLLEFFDSLIMLLPSFIAAFGIFSAWLTKGALRLICWVTEDASAFFYRPTSSPRGLAIIFFAASIAGVFSGEGQFYFIVSNLSNALILLFAFEGIRELVTAPRSGRPHRGMVTLIVLAVYSVIVMPTFLVVLAGYYGAFRAVFSGMPSPGHGAGKA